MGETWKEKFEMASIYSTEKPYEEAKKSSDETILYRQARDIERTTRRLRELTTNIDAMSDRLFGTIPVEAQATGREVGFGGHVAVATEAVEAQSGAVDRLSAAVDRLLNGLS